MTGRCGQRIAGARHEQVVAGLGSPHGDDQAGWVLSETLTDRCPPRVSVFAVRTPLDVLSRISPDVWLHVIDACDAGREPGTLLRWCTADRERCTEQTAVPEIVRSCRAATTHDMDLLSVLELARHLEQFPAGVTVWMIQGRSFEPLSEMSEEVIRMLPETADAVLKELNWRSSAHRTGEVH